MIRDGFGRRLKFERLRIKLSQRELSEAIGITPNTQRAYEREKDTIDLFYLKKAESIGIDVMYVLSGRNEQLNCLQPEEQELLHEYRKLSRAKRSEVRKHTKKLSNSAEVVGDIENVASSSSATDRMYPHREKLSSRASA
ncbi:helix-turn-helix domain-containing protein [Pseudomonas sp. PDM13]|uniref:helix-turn-helix domain-containing protein n=1 Tax=Pseudomonas sp. PDM13 TaxID=2769255 RepID=UPI0021DFD2AF|nr:helix-turn-helix transcriptional regulator [Pseudomonas sp. PDM13]MCU9949870.1 helix-turn-helix domain-containing protein [Pseudomonas sp. PDM13]